MELGNEICVGNRKKTWTNAHTYNIFLVADKTETTSTQCSQHLRLRIVEGGIVLSSTTGSDGDMAVV